MSASVYHLLHVGGVILLVAFTFQAFGAAGKARGGAMLTGILSAVFLIAGFGLISKLDYEFSSGWILVKMICGLALAAIAAMAPKRPALRGPLTLGAIVTVLVAVYMVYFRPF